MISVKFDNKELNKILKNSVSYSEGFLEGANYNLIYYNAKLGELIVDILYKYIDSKARMNPESLHHVYEWGQVGSASGRLFEIKSTASRRFITFSGEFLRSTSIKEGSSEPFTEKASIMENSIQVVIEPKNSSVLVFENDGETVFTPHSVVVANPGGDEVAGSFGRVIDEFFDRYLTVAVMRSFGIFDKLDTAREFGDFFAAGTKQGRSAGVKAGRKYLDLPLGIGVQ